MPMPSRIRMISGIMATAMSTPPRIKKPIRPLCTSPARPLSRKLSHRLLQTIVHRAQPRPGAVAGPLRVLGALRLSASNRLAVVVAGIEEIADGEVFLGHQ